MRNLIGQIESIKQTIKEQGASSVDQWNTYMKPQVQVPEYDKKFLNIKL